MRARNGNVVASWRGGVCHPPRRGVIVKGTAVVDLRRSPVRERIVRRGSASLSEGEGNAAQTCVPVWSRAPLRSAHVLMRMHFSFQERRGGGGQDRERGREEEEEGGKAPSPPPPLRKEIKKGVKAAARRGRLPSFFCMHARDLTIFNAFLPRSVWFFPTHSLPNAFLT